MNKYRKINTILIIKRNIINYLKRLYDKYYNKAKEFII